MYEIILTIIMCIIWYDWIIKRKIVSVYTNTSYFGLGDYIRGIIYLYQQNDNNSNIFINYDDHDINKYLYNKCGNTSTFNYKDILVTNEKTYPIISNTTNNLYLYNNAAITYPIDKNILKNVKQMFTPKPYFQKKINNILKNTCNGPFAIIHIRLNDDVFVKDRILNDPILNNNIVNICETKEQIIVMSNSILTKTNLYEKYKSKLKFINTIPSHTGAIGTKGDIEGTLIEFFIMSKSSIIYQYCETKEQKSGFSQRISEIYEIPLIKMY